MNNNCGSNQTTIESKVINVLETKGQMNYLFMKWVSKAIHLNLLLSRHHSHRAINNGNISWAGSVPCHLISKCWPLHGTDPDRLIFPKWCFNFIADLDITEIYRHNSLWHITHLKEKTVFVIPIDLLILINTLAVLWADVCISLQLYIIIFKMFFFLNLAWNYSLLEH